MRYYRDFLEELEMEEEKEKIKETVSVDVVNSEITIVKEKGLTRLVKFITYKFEDILKVLIFIFILGVLSIGATVLLNVELREELIYIFKQSFGV